MPASAAPRSLEKRALDSLIAQLLSKLDSPARIVGPNASLSPLDDRYIGPLKLLLMEAIPGIPEPLLSGVRDDLIVVTRANNWKAVDPLNPAPDLVSFGASTLRLSKAHAKLADELDEEYGDVLAVEVRPSRYIETDLVDTHLVFHEHFFAPRSIKSWARLALYFARLTAKMEELAKRSGLKPSGVISGRSDNHLVHSQFQDRFGREGRDPF